MGLEIIKKSDISPKSDEYPYNIGSIYRFVGKGRNHIPYGISFYMCTRISNVLCMVSLNSGIARPISQFDTKNMKIIDVTDKVKFQIDIPRSTKDIFPIRSQEYEIGQTYLSNDVFMVICRQLHPEQLYVMFLANGNVQPLVNNKYYDYDIYADRFCDVKMYVDE